MATEPWLMADVKMKNLLKKPANGGIPARENIASVIAKDSQGEHGEHHRAGQPGVGARQAVVVGHRNLAGLVLDGADHTECAEVGEHVDKHVENQRTHAYGAEAFDAEHDVTGLRD